MSIVGRGLPRAAAAGRIVAVALLWAVSAGCAGSAAPGPSMPSNQPPAARPGATAGEPREAPAPHTAVLGGAILDAAARAPLGRARIILTSPALPEPRVAISGEDGRYLFERLPPGLYNLSVSRSGFATQESGERRSAPAAPVSVEPGQRLTTVDIALARAGAIAGQILDEDGQPFAGAVVSAVVTRFELEQTTFVSMATAQTDDRGEFRLAGLPAGEYFVSAFDPAFTSVGDDTGPLRYTPTYHPGVATVADAARVTVVPGAEPPRVVFPLRIVRPARVLGRLTAQDGTLLTSGAIMMSPLTAEGLTPVPAEDMELRGDGSFEIRNVPPGRYQIRARGETSRDGPVLFATFRLGVEGADTRNVNMVLTRGTRVSGRVVVEAVHAPKPVSFAGLRVRAPFTDGSSFGDSLTGEVGPDGAFTIRGIMPGNHVITVEGLAYPWVLKTVAVRGRDISDVGLVAETGESFTEVVVVVTDVASELSGTVRAADGMPAPEATVVILPVAQQFWTRTSRRVALLRTDADGRYRVRGLPSGDYRAIASPDLDETDVYRRDVLLAMAAKGAPLTVTGAGRHPLDLTALPALSLRPATPR